MSKIKTVDTNQVSQIVDNFLSDKTIKLSQQHVDTYYLCSHDLKTLLSLTRDIQSNANTTYSITLDGIGSANKLNQDIIKNLYKLVDTDRVRYTPVKITSTEAKKEWNEKAANASIQDKEKFLSELLGKGIVYYIHRTFYYFDKQGLKKSDEIPSTFPTFQHNAKLVEYSGPRNLVWFYTDDTNSTGFKEMNLQSGKIFNKVKIALQNQKQNVK